MYFDYQQLETKCGDRQKVFDYSINTDGVTVSFSMQITEPDTELAKVADDNAEMPLWSNKNLQLIKQRLQDSYYSKIVGLNPGQRLMVGGN